MAWGITGMRTFAPSNGTWLTAGRRTYATVASQNTRVTTTGQWLPTQFPTADFSQVTRHILPDLVTTVALLFTKNCTRWARRFRMAGVLRFVAARTTLRAGLETNKRKVSPLFKMKIPVIRIPDGIQAVAFHKALEDK